MKFSVKEKPLAVAPPPAPMTVEQVRAASEDLMCSYMELTDAQRNLDEVCQVMENIELSMKMIKTGGMDAVKLLNIDKSLEGLLGVAEEKMTVQATQEGLSQALSEGWKKFKEFVKSMVARIVEFFKNLIPTRTVYVEKTVEKIVEVSKQEDIFNKEVRITGRLVRTSELYNVVQSLERVMDILEWGYTAPKVEEGTDLVTVASKLLSDYNTFLKTKIDGKLLITPEDNPDDGGLTRFVPYWYHASNKDKVYVISDADDTVGTKLSQAGYTSTNDITAVQQTFSYICNIEKKLGSYLRSTFEMNEDEPGSDYLVIRAQFKIAQKLSRWIAVAIKDLSDTLALCVHIAASKAEE